MWQLLINFIHTKFLVKDCEFKFASSDAIDSDFSEGKIIKTSFYNDKFKVMNLVKGNDFYNVRYQIKPFMIWIWISTLLIIIGGLLSLFKRLYEK